MLACAEICFLSFVNFVQAGFMTVVGCHHNYQYRSRHLFGCFPRFILVFQSVFLKVYKTWRIGKTLTKIISNGLTLTRYPSFKMLKVYVD